MAGFREFKTSDRVLDIRMNEFGNQLYSEITKYSTYDLYLKQGNLMNPQKPTGAGTEVIFANVTGVEQLAYTFNYAIPEDLIISKDNRYNLVIPFKQLDVNRSFVFRFLYKHEGTTIFDITRNAATTATGDLTVEFQALNQNVSDIVALANTTVTLQIFVKTLTGTDAQISLLVNDVNALGRLSRNEATAIVSADNVLMPDGVTSVSSAIEQSTNFVLSRSTNLAGQQIFDLGFSANKVTVFAYLKNNANYQSIGSHSKKNGASSRIFKYASNGIWDVGSNGAIELHSGNATNLGKISISGNNLIIDWVIAGNIAADDILCHVVAS